MPLFTEAAIRAALVVAFAGQGADITTTAVGVTRYELREASPLGLTGVMAGKAALLAFVPWTMKTLDDNGHPRWATGVGVTVGVAGFIPAVLNIRTMLKKR